jgi:hypothetical protein
VLFALREMPCLRPVAGRSAAPPFEALELRIASSYFCWI